MAKYTILFLFLFQITFSRQLITNGDILFYYNDEKNIAEDIKGNIFSAIDLSQIDVGIIIEGEHFYLRDYVEETLTDKEESLVENYGKIREIPFKIGYYFINENEFTIKVLFSGELPSKDEIKVSYNLFPQKDNGYLELGKEGKYIYDGRITFQDSENQGGMYFSLDPVQKGSRYLLSKITGREVNYSDRYIYYIVPVKNREASLTIKFGFLSNRKETIKTSDLSLENYGDVEREQITQLRLFLSRAVIPSEISYNIPENNYINELNLKYIGIHYNLSYISDILEKQRPKILERIYYDFMIFKIIDENPNLKNRGKDFYRYTQTYIDNIFEEIYNDGDIREIFYLYKLLEIMQRYALEEKEFSEKIKIYKNKILEIVREKFLHEEGIKNSRYSKTFDSKNLIYSELLDKENRKSFLERELNKNYSKDYGVFFQKDNIKIIKEIDMEYNFNMVIFLYDMGERKKGDLLLGKLEELIRKNSYYIPRYYTIKNKNENGIYGEMISKYLEILKRGERW